MIIGIGNDIILIKRVTNAIKNPRFLKKCFSENEILMINKKNKISASNFSAKEAFVKALGTGFINTNIKDIEVLRDEFGKPYINLLGDAKSKFPDDAKIFVTISHSDEYVMSTVVIERLK